MKISLPATQTPPPPDLPQNTFGKLLTSTPVIMTVVSTLMAGLSNSEMTRGQYDRSSAAQLQSKVGDQWSFYQARRIRSATIRSGASVLSATVESLPLNREALVAAVGTKMADPLVTNAIDCLLSGTIPKASAGTETEGAIQKALEAIAAGKSDRELAPILATVSEEQLDEAIQVARTNSAAFDQQMGNLGRGLDLVESSIREQLKSSQATSRPLWRDFSAARMHLDALRFDAEARMSQPVAYLLELQVRLGNREAERHRIRSGRFFVGMLGAQLAVVIATFALAVQRRNVVWSVAASLGLAAIGFGIYVYLHD